MSKQEELYVAQKEIFDKEYDLNVNPTPKIVTLKKVKYNPATGKYEDVQRKNMAYKEKEVDDWVASAKTIEPMPYGYYQNEAKHWKSKLTKIGKVHHWGCIDFLLYAKTDFNYGKNIAIRVTLSTYNDTRVEVRIKPLHENDRHVIGSLYTIHVDKDGYIWIGVAAVFLSHVHYQIISVRNSDLFFDSVKTHEELNAIGSPILPITEINTQDYYERVENYVI